MKTLRSDLDGAHIELSLQELDLVRNGLNEALLLVSEADFDTRLGASKAEADELVVKLQSLITEIMNFKRASGQRETA